MTEKSLSDKRLALLEDNLKKINDEIAQTAIKNGRDPSEITLMAVTKTVPAQLINHAIKCGVKLIGENRVQEVLEKREQLDLNGCGLHLIGHLQSNKVKKIVGIADMIESVDSFDLAARIDRCSLERGTVTDILVEVNIGQDKDKFGYDAAAVEDSLRMMAQLRSIRVRGMMTIAPNFKDSAKNQSVFADMHKLFVDICAKKIDNIYMDVLSMGMSGDFKEAIAEGATQVRVGSAIFGERKY